MVQAESEQVLIGCKCIAHSLAAQVPDEVLSHIEFLQSLLAFSQRVRDSNHSLVSEIVSEQIKVLHTFVCSKTFSERNAEGVDQVAMLEGKVGEGVIIGDYLAD